jgi:uncharacterized membrane protein
VISSIGHTLHVILAGVWLGGVVFTTLVVSPALKRMKWSEAKRVGVRSVIGKQYARVGTINLILLLVFAVIDGLVGGFGTVLYAEYALLAAVFGLVAVHGGYFGRRLARLAAAERNTESAEESCAFVEKRRSLQRLSLWVSWANVLISVAIVALAVAA